MKTSKNKGTSGAAQAYGAARLRTKTAREAIVHAIGRDFNLTPIIAEAYFSQVASYFSQHANVTLNTGQVCYEAVSADEPANKHIALASREILSNVVYEIIPGASPTSFLKQL